jgi:hypothetical protein
MMVDDVLRGRIKETVIKGPMGNIILFKFYKRNQIILLFEKYIKCREQIR